MTRKFIKGVFKTRKKISKGRMKTRKRIVTVQRRIRKKLGTNKILTSKNVAKKARKVITKIKRRRSNIRSFVTGR